MGLDEETVEQVRLAGPPPRPRQDRDPRPHPAEARQARPRRAAASCASTPELGYRLLEGLGVSPVDRWIRHHHEWWDGCGYPLGLAGEEIPLGSRIILVADAFDAMTSDRVLPGGGHGRGGVSPSCGGAAGRSSTRASSRRSRSTSRPRARISPSVRERGRLMVLAAGGRARRSSLGWALGGGLAPGRPAPARDLALLRRDRPADRRLSRRGSCRGASGDRLATACGSRPTPA